MNVFGQIDKSHKLWLYGITVPVVVAVKMDAISA